MTHGLPGAPALPPRPTGTGWSAGAIVLALGATCLVVAAIIFVGVAWGSLGVGGRALVLLVVTAIFGGVAFETTRRELRASAETLWAVTLGLLTVDWFAAVGLGLLDLDRLDPDWAVAIWSLGLGAAAVGVVLLGRALGTRELVVPSVVAGLLVWSFALAVGSVVAPDGQVVPAVVVSTILLVLAAAATGVLRLLRVTVGTWIGVAAVAAAALALVVSAVVDVLEHPSVGELLRGHGYGLLSVGLVLVGMAVALRRRAELATTLGSFGGLALLLLVATPVQDGFPHGGLAVLLAAVVAGLPWFLATSGPLVRAARVVVGAAAGVLGLLSLPWLASVLVTSGQVVTSGPGLDWSDRTGPDRIGYWQGWVALVVAVGLCAGVGAAARWSAWQRLRPHVVPVVAWTVGLAVVAAVCARPPRLVVLVLALAVVPVLLTAVLHRRAGWRWSALAVTAGVPILVSGSSRALVVLAAVVVLTSLAVALPRGGGALWRRTAAALATGWLAVAVLPAAVLLDLGARPVALTEAVLTVVGLGVAALLRGRDPRLGLEVGLLVPAVLALGAGTVSLGWLALVLTVLGAGAVAVALLVADRRPLAVVGSAALGLAYVLRLVASDVRVVEAYTVPFAVALVLAGLLAMRRRDAGSVAVLPGLLLGCLPSLTVAMGAPTSLRALLVGLVGVVLLAGGLVLRWRWPFLVGTTVLAVVVLRNVGPEAWALPRWIVIAVVGLALLGVGVTWDHRVRDGRAALRFVGRMR
ncbi:MAG: hypothetical protein PGN07_03660 [Aeromicrobium erythreum]